jgi:hypothetical protein
MERLRVRMLQTKDQLRQDSEYFLPEDIARSLESQGLATILAIPGESTVGPSETKPAEPPELKSPLESDTGRNWKGAQVIEAPTNEIVVPPAEPGDKPSKPEPEPEPATPPKPPTKPAPQPMKPPAKKPAKKHAHR